MPIKNKILEIARTTLAQKLLLIIISLCATSGIYSYFAATYLDGSSLLLSTMIFGLISALLFFTFNHRPNKRSSIILAAFSGLMAASIVIGDKINLADKTAITPQWMDAAYWLVWLLLIFYLSSFVLVQLRKVSYRIIGRQSVSSKLWLRASIAMFILWIPYFLAFFPGILNSDTSDQLRQALGDARLNNHHPALIAGFISLFAHLGLLVSGGNHYAAIAFVTIAQMAVVACVLGYVVAWIAARFNSAVISLSAAAFFALFPIVPYFAVTIGKDTFFAISILLLTTGIYDLVRSKGELFKNRAWLLYFAAVALLVIFTRNNGLYIIILTLLSLLIAFRHLRRAMVPAFVFIIAFALLVQGPVFSVLKIPLSSSTESFGVLLQQVGRAVAVGGELSESDKQAITPLLPLEKWARYYQPSTPDRLKFCYTAVDACMDNEYLDKHKFAFLRAWLSIGIKNPRAYIDAFLAQNSGFWHIGSPDDYGSFKSDEQKYTHGSIDVFDSTLGIPASRAVAKIVFHIRSSPIGVIVNQAFLIWIIMFAGAVLIIRRHYGLLLVLLPSTALWLSLMLAAPAMSFRYSLATFFILPVVLAIVAAYGSAKSTRA